MIIGIDIGGTFTDIVCSDEARRRVHFCKILTDHADIVVNVERGVDRMLEATGGSRSDIRRLVHGTTIATNVVVQEVGARTAVLSTEGFEDVLEIGRIKRRNMYDLNIGVQTPVFLSPKRLRAGIPERVGPSGEVIRPLDEAAVERAIRRLKERFDVESVAIVYLFSFLNPRHEIRTREIVKSLYPDLFVSISSEVDPLYREYERTVVTTFDAYLRPRIERFMGDLKAQLRGRGLEAQIQIMQSRGGVTSIESAGRRPVNLFLSGPAGGVVGASRLARASGEADVITIDIGGTSTDVALVHRGAPSMAAAGEIRGVPVRVPMVDISTIGAGGGSVLWLDRAGGLRVGPRSAGSEPGPVCYRRGGTEPTITDASLVLGYFNPGAFAGGALDLDLEGARRALDGLGRPMGLSATQVALGAHRIMNAQMVEQIRLMTVKRGHDPRGFGLFAFGGGGPLHAGALISMLSLKKAIVPLLPGVLSAFGLMGANVELEQLATHLAPIATLDLGALQGTFGELRAGVGEQMKGEGFGPDEIEFTYGADMRYVGQSYELTVPFARPVVSPEAIAGLVRDFRAQYERTYGYASQSEVEIVCLRVTAIRPYDLPSLLDVGDDGASASGRSAPTRRAMFLGHPDPMATAVHHRSDLAVASAIAGPAIIEQSDTTVLVYPGQRAVVDPMKNLILTGVAQGYAL